VALSDVSREDVLSTIREYGFVVTRNGTSLLPAEEQSDEDTTICGRLRHDDEKWSDPEEYKDIYAGKDNVCA